MRNTVLQKNPKNSKKIIPFVTLSILHLIAGNHNLAQILKNLPIVAYRKDKSLKIMSGQELLHFNLITKELYTVGVKWQHYNNLKRKTALELHKAFLWRKK